VLGELRARMTGRCCWLPLAILVLLLVVGGLVTAQFIPFKYLHGMACVDGIESLPTFAAVSHRQADRGPPTDRHSGRQPCACASQTHAPCASAQGPASRASKHGQGVQTNS
jgi:hypothetical protein